MKLYIRSLYSFVDQVSKNILQKTIFQLVEEYDQLEFWFVAWDLKYTINNILFFYTY